MENFGQQWTTASYNALGQIETQTIIDKDCNLENIALIAHIAAASLHKSNSAKPRET